MTRATLFGAGYVTRTPAEATSLQLQEGLVDGRIKFYRHAAAAEPRGDGEPGPAAARTRAARPARHRLRSKAAARRPARRPSGR